MDHGEHGEQDDVFIDIISEIQDEDVLNTYTETHLNTVICNDLEKLKKQYPIDDVVQYPIDENENEDNDMDDDIFYSKMSPVVSINGSDDENDAYHSKTKYKKLTNKDIEKVIEQYYKNDNNDNYKYFSGIDILTTYVKGQKNLFITSKYITQYKLNVLMILALVLSTFVTIITPFFCEFHWIEMVISTMNGLIVLCISLINFLKLESSVEKYLHLANHYDSLETSLEFVNSKLLFITNKEEREQLMLSKIKKFEKKMIENKESNPILFPDEIKKLYPIVCTLNIFSFIKKTEYYKKMTITKLKNIQNEIQYILYKPTNTTYDHYAGQQDVSISRKRSQSRVNPPKKEQSRLTFLYEMKNNLRNELVEFQFIYGFLDDIIINEINHANLYKNPVSIYFKTSQLPKECIKNMNPMIQKHFVSIGLIEE